MKCLRQSRKKPPPDLVRKKANPRFLHPRIDSRGETIAVSTFMPEGTSSPNILGQEDFVARKRKVLGEFTVFDVLPLVFQTPADRGAGSLVPRRPVLPIYPSSWTSGSSEDQIPWLVLFQSMEERLNQMMLILARLSSGEKVNLPVPVPVEISSTGMVFPSEKAYSSGESLHILIDLPVFPPLEMDVLAHVSACSLSSREPGTDVLVGFDSLSAGLRDSLLQYIVVRQREEIRQGQKDRTVATSRRIG